MFRRLLPTGRMVLIGRVVRVRCSHGAGAGKAWRAARPIVPASGGGGARGSWYFSLDLPRHVDGKAAAAPGGYLTCDAAAVARDRLSVSQPGDPGGRILTVADWLETWVETRVRLRDSTRRIYRSHIRQHLRRLFDGCY